MITSFIIASGGFLSWEPLKESINGGFCAYNEKRLQTENQYRNSGRVAYHVEENGCRSRHDEHGNYCALSEIPEGEERYASEGSQ